MGNIVVHEFTTLDGVIDAPTWTFDFGFDPKMDTAIAEIMGDCSGLLVGRRTLEMFALAWPVRTAAEDPGAPFMNDSHKYVVCSALNVEWNDSTCVGQYGKEEIAGMSFAGMSFAGDSANTGAVVAPPDPAITTSAKRLPGWSHLEPVVRKPRDRHRAKPPRCQRADYHSQQMGSAFRSLGRRSRVRWDAITCLARKSHRECHTSIVEKGRGIDARPRGSRLELHRLWAALEHGHVHVHVTRDMQLALVVHGRRMRQPQRMRALAYYHGEWCLPLFTPVNQHSRASWRAGDVQLYRTWPARRRTQTLW